MIPGHAYSIPDTSALRSADPAALQRACAPKATGTTNCLQKADVPKPSPEEAQKAGEEVRKLLQPTSAQSDGGVTTNLVPEYNLSCVYLAFHDSGAASQEWNGNRTSACRMEHWVAFQYVDSTLVGQFWFDLYLSQDLENAGSGVPWRVEFIARTASYWPNGTITTLHLNNLSLSSVAPCSTGFGGQIPLSLSPESGQTEDAQFWYPQCTINSGATINVPRTKINFTPWDGVNSYGAKSIQVSDNQVIRCDAVRGNIGPGCVMPKITGIIQFDRTQYPLLQVPATNYLNWQIQFPNHVGYYNDYYGYGAPLTYTNSSAISDANYAAACGAGSGWVAPPAPNNSCDEYPFGSTLEGAAMAGGSYGVTWGRNGVTTQQNSSGGGTLSAGYSRLHILNGDKFLAQVI